MRDPRVCSACQHVNPAGAKFCKKCGQRLASSVAPPTSSGEPETKEAPLFTPKSQDDSEASAVQKSVSKKQKAAGSGAARAPQKRSACGCLFLEGFRLAAVCGLLGWVYYLGVEQFGKDAMAGSDVRDFGVFVLEVLVALRLFRGLIDKLLMKLYLLLGIIPSRLRILLGLAFPLAYAVWENEDRQSGFETARPTVILCVVVAHILIRSTAFKRKSR